MGIDLTPGFNIAWNPDSLFALPYVAATGTKTVLGAGSDKPKAPAAPSVAYKGPTPGTTPAPSAPPTSSGQYQENTYSGGGGGGGSYSSAAAAPTYDPQAQAYYQDLINRANGQVGNLDSQYNVGLENINNARNEQFNQLQGSQARDERDYNTTRTNTITDQETAKRNIDSQVRQRTNALQRLLGLGGSGNSSAALYAAPEAVGREGSVNRSAIQQNYGRNLSALDTNWEDTQDQYKNSFSDLDNQVNRQRNDLQRGTDSARASLLDTLAGLTTQLGQARGQNYTQAAAAASPYVNQISGINSRAADLSRQYANPVLQVAKPTYATPSLSSYDAGNVANVNVPAEAAGAAGNVGPYYYLFGNDRDRQNRLA